MMQVLIKKDYEECSAFLADYAAGKINSFKPSASRPFVLGLPTGSSPVGAYKRLAALCQSGKISFENVITFNMDEYIGLAREHRESYYRFMHENFFNHIDIKKENVNMLDGMASDPATECENFEEKIKTAGGINLFLCGIGANGHLAFNEPGSPLTSRTRITTLAEATRKANSRFFDNDIDKVPKSALTVGVGTVTDAEEILLMAFGECKAEALCQAIEGEVSDICPASALQLHQNCTIVCDEAAAGKLQKNAIVC